MRDSAGFRGSGSGFECDRFVDPGALASVRGVRSVAGIAGPVGILITCTLAVSVSWLTSDGSEPTAGPDEKCKNRKTRGDAPRGPGLTAQERDG
jgi:hypothetical protein